MSYKYSFKCPLPNGVHARPASNIVEIAETFNSSINITNERNGRKCNAKSALSIIASDFQLNDDCKLVVTGQDEKDAFEKLKTFFIEKFSECDEPLPQFKSSADEILLPPLLRATEFEYINGIPVVSGIAQGSVVIVSKISIPSDIAERDAGTSDEEHQKIKHALQSLSSKLETQLQNQAFGTEAEILKAHLAIARDIELKKKLLEIISLKKCNVAEAIAGTIKFFTDVLMETESVLLHERVLDIQDICSQLLIEVYGESARPPKICLKSPSVCIAESLTPLQLLEMDRTYLKALVLSATGTTSHTVILARSFGIPTLTGVHNAHSCVTSGQEVLVDADLGILVTGITPSVKHYYKLETNKTAHKKQQLEKYVDLPAVTIDGSNVEVAANVATVEEIEAAFDVGADGIGLFRTEMLFMQNGSAPSEDEQFKIYRRAAEAAGDRPVIIRTLDVGGDKPLPYLDMPKETNPFLGCRGVRMYPKIINIFTDQLKAIIRASAFGNLKLMIPMVSCLEEIRWVRKHIVEIQIRYQKESVPYNPDMEVGIMIEIPSTAFIINQLCKDVDFFSIGTNDLAQYFIAVDRENSKVAKLKNPLNPSFIKLLKKIVEDIHSCGKWVGMCGEMAGQASALPLLIGLKLDELSLSVPRILEVKAAICSTEVAKCHELVEKVTDCETTENVKQTLESFGRRGVNLPILESNLIITGSNSRNKHEVIKEITDNFYITNRTNNPREIEEAVWQREKVYSTALSHGFAIPHCKTDNIMANSISVLKPKQPIDWETDNNENQDIVLVILMAVRKSSDKGDHMRIFSKLARKLMDKEFTSYILKEQDSDVLVAYLRDKLEI